MEGQNREKNMRFQTKNVLVWTRPKAH